MKVSNYSSAIVIVGVASFLFISQSAQSAELNYEKFYGVFEVPDSTSRECLQAVGNNVLPGSSGKYIRVDNSRRDHIVDLVLTDSSALPAPSAYFPADLLSGGNQDGFAHSYKRILHDDGKNITATTGNANVVQSMQASFWTLIPWGAEEVKKNIWNRLEVRDDSLVLSYHLMPSSPISNCVFPRLGAAVVKPKLELPCELETTTGAIFTCDHSNPNLGEAHREPGGLIWGEQSEKSMSQSQAAAYCKSLGARLPTEHEFYNLAVLMGRDFGIHRYGKNDPPAKFHFSSFIKGTKSDLLPRFMSTTGYWSSDGNFDLHSQFRFGGYIFDTLSVKNTRVPQGDANPVICVQ
jgi:hypothetical protein